MQLEIKLLPAKKLIGKHLKMSLALNRTAELWKSFSSQKREIQNPIGTLLYSVQIYNSAYFAAFNPNNEFEKWAAIEVTEFENIPDTMEAFLLEGGLYAVFNYRGLSTDTKIFEYIFSSWLPSSNYVLDNRPHFEVLGEKYKNNDPSSEEEIWIPIALISNANRF